MGYGHDRLGSRDWPDRLLCLFGRMLHGVVCGMSSDFERLVRRGAVVNKIRAILRRRRLKRPISMWWW